jgi:hypothetical protein
MNKLKNNTFLSAIFITLALLLFLKIDFRFQDTVFCCGDDHDYYMHAETIAVDFDLDYSNQLKGIETKRFNFKDNIAPTGFIGSGILASPFLFIGHSIDKIISQENVLSQEILNFRILFYSLSSVFYLFLTINLTFKILNILKYHFSKFNILIIYFGSGLAYYAFERFSMTHVYECFSVTMIVYLSLKYYQSPEVNKYAYLLPIFIAIGLAVRWVNYFYFLLPLVSYYLISEKKEIKNRLSKDNYFIAFSILSSGLFLLHTKVLYGQFTFNPQFVYGTGGQVSNFISRDGKIIDFFLINVVNSFKVMFTQEFGLFWLSPILFVGFTLVLCNLFTNKKRETYFNLLILFSYLQIFAVVLLWRSTASSYGFRYLFCLIPLSIILYYRFQNQKSRKLIEYYLVIFSIFSTISILFFETTEGTQLALVETTNTFGRSLKYTQPLYLQGYLTSFIELNSYLKIFTTSFLGAIVFKLLLVFFDKDKFLDLLDGYGLPVQNEDFVNYISEVNDINIHKFFIVIIVFYIFGHWLAKNFATK